MNPLFLNPYVAGGLAVAFAFYSGWLFTQGRHFEQNRQVRAVIAINNKLEDVNRKETKVFIRDLALRTKAHAEAKPVLAKAGACTVTDEEAISIARVK